MSGSPHSANPSPPRAARLRLAAIAALVVAIAVLAVAAVFWLRPQPTSPVANSGVMRVPAGAAIGGPFTLVDHTGRAVTEADFAGRFMLIYFGFTHCPDICPTELQIMANAVDSLGGDARQVVPVFITVDPERDTPAHLKDYVAAFHARMVGLTGTPEQIAAVAKAYKIYFSKVEADGGYQVDHTSFVYLIGPDGVLRTVFRGGTSDKAMAAEIRDQLRQTG